MTIALSMIAGCGIFVAGFFIGKKQLATVEQPDLKHIKTPDGKFFTNRVVMEEKDNE